MGHAQFENGNDASHPNASDCFSKCRVVGTHPSIFLDLHDEYGQDDLMPHSDVAPGIFWVSVVPTITVIWILATLICRFVILRKAKLPARLWGVDHKRTYRSVGLTSLYGVMIGLLAVFTVLSAVYFKWG